MSSNCLEESYSLLDKQSCKHIQGFSQIALHCLCPLLATCHTHDCKTVRLYHQGNSSKSDGKKNSSFQVALAMRASDVKTCN